MILQGTEQMHVKKKETVTTADEDDDLDEYEEENLKKIKEKVECLWLYCTIMNS